ncbi:MAG: carboxypeptidase-like regulatory domain-containing protein, partial [Planctomycetota bacterium]
MRTIRRVTSGAVLLLLAAAGTQTAPAGTISGHGRFERIAGNPGMGYKELYEWDLFLSPSDNSTVGPSRRLGAPPGQPPTGDGYYRIDGLPAGTYSAYVNQPDFFASPKVVPNVQVPQSGQTQVNVDLDVDYSTYFRDSGQWTDWQWDWYQTYTAVGTSVRGVSWVMAGWGEYNGKTARVRIL